LTKEKAQNNFLQKVQDDHMQQARQQQLPLSSPPKKVRINKRNINRLLPNYG